MTLHDFGEVSVGNALRGVPYGRHAFPAWNAAEGVPYRRDAPPGIVQGPLVLRYFL
jgi:hypothetical protein